MLGHQIPSISPNTGVVFLQNGSVCRIAHPLSSRRRIHLSLMSVTSCLSATYLPQNPNGLPPQHIAGISGRSRKTLISFSLYTCTNGNIRYGISEILTALRVFYKRPLPGLAQATYVPDFRHILLAPDPKRAILGSNLDLMRSFLNVVSIISNLDRDP